MAQRNPQQAAAAPAPAQPAQLAVTLAHPSPRLNLIRKIERIRNSRVIAYVTADRPDLAGQMGDDVPPILFDHLEAMGKQQKIDLFLHTRGGYTLAPLRLAHLIREYCDEFGVLVARFAHSAGTGLAIAANEIVMHRMAELGPIDPTVANEFNPLDSADPDKKRRIPIAVEDVSAYLALARNLGKVPDSEMAGVFEALTKEIHPLALGNIHRQYLLIRTMSARLLKMQFGEKDNERVERILRTLTEELYFHGYPISRAEARDFVGLNVVFASGELEDSLWQLYSEYRDTLRFGEPAIGVDPARLGTSGVTLEVEAAAVESEAGLHTFYYEGVAKPRPAQGKLPPAIDVQVKGQWRKR